MALLANIKQLFVPHKANGNGKDPVTFRDYGDDMRIIETWAKQQKGKPSRSEAIRRLIEIALTGKSKRQSSRSDK